jgi:hypothetical protein
MEVATVPSNQLVISCHTLTDALEEAMKSRPGRYAICIAAGEPNNKFVPLSIVAQWESFVTRTNVPFTPIDSDGVITFWVPEQAQPRVIEIAAD